MLSGSVFSNISVRFFPILGLKVGRNIVAPTLIGVPIWNRGRGVNSQGCALTEAVDLVITHDPVFKCATGDGQPDFDDGPLIHLFCLCTAFQRKERRQPGKTDDIFCRAKTAVEQDNLPFPVCERLIHEGYGV